MRKILAFIFNIQLFAEEVSDANITSSSDLSAEMKTYYHKQLIALMGPALVFDQFASKKDIPKGGGKTIEFRRFEDLSDDLGEAVLAENVIPDGQELSVQTINAEISQFGRYIKIGDVAEKTMIDPILAEGTKKIADQASRIANKITREKMLEGTNVMYCPKVAADGSETEVTSRDDLDKSCKLRVKDIFKAATQLKSVNAPKIGDSYVATIHPNVAFDIMMEAGDKWIDIQKYSNPEAIFKGEIGKIGGVRFVESTECKIYNESGSNAVYCTFVMGEEAYATTGLEGVGIEHIFHDKHEIGGALDQFSTVGWKLFKTAEILKDDYLIRIESGSSYNNAAAN